MRALMAAVIFMGVLIVAGVALIGLKLAGTLPGPGPAAPVAALLDEPAGTRIAGLAALGDRLAVSLAGGGPDRIALLDARTGRLVGEIRLAH